MGDKSHRDYCPGRVDLGPNWGCWNYIFLCFSCFCNFFYFHNFSCFHNFHWRCQQSSGLGDFPALSSSSGKLAEDWSMGIAHWRVPPKGVAGTKVWVTWPILGPSHPPLQYTFCELAGSTGEQWLCLFCPVLECLNICQSLPRLS